MSSPKEEKDNNIMRDFKKVCVCDKIKPIGFIGCGNMGTAILTGIIKSKMFEPEDIIVSAQSDESIERLKKLNVTTTKSNLEVFDGSRIIFLCIKPNKLEAVSKDLIEYDTNKPYTRQLVSILAGTSIETLKTTLNIPDISVIRTMPNVALQVGAGCTAMSSIDRDDDYTFINFHITKTIFAALGVVEVINDEKLFHSIVGLSGSGPAYIFILIEALSDAGVKQGLTRDMATKFATQTVYGASKMLLETGLHPGKAKDQVASAGGTTIHGIHELEKGAFRNTIINAVEAGAKRSIDMSKN